MIVINVYRSYVLANTWANLTNIKDTSLEMVGSPDYPFIDRVNFLPDSESRCSDESFKQKRTMLALILKKLQAIKVSKPWNCELLKCTQINSIGYSVCSIHKLTITRCWETVLDKQSLRTWPYTFGGCDKCVSELCSCLLSQMGTVLALIWKKRQAIKVSKPWNCEMLKCTHINSIGYTLCSIRELALSILIDSFGQIGINNQAVDVGWLW